MRPKLQIDYEKVKNLAGRGLTKEQIGMCLGISRRSVFNKQIEDPKFAAAMEEGHANAVAAVTGMLFKNINLGNVPSVIFFLKCRAGWKETHIVENRDLPAIPGGDCSNEEAEAAYIASMRAPK